MIYFSRTLSPLGTITLAADGDRLTGVWLEGQKHFPDLSGWEEAPKLPVFTLTERWLEQYFAGKQPDPGIIPLAPSGTPIQLQLWQILREIPYGSVTTYGELAQKLGCKSPRAVGNAVGRNPLSILIPCHRVVGKDGSLTGYAGGTERKQYLLELENAI